MINCDCNRFIQNTIDRQKDYEQRVQDMRGRRIIPEKTGDMGWQFWFEFAVDGVREEKKWRKKLERSHRLYCKGELSIFDMLLNEI